MADTADTRLERTDAEFSLPPAVPQHAMSPHQLPATPFAQTAWGQLAYGIASAATGQRQEW
jgi:hypothetical protein